ncbi:hypothetical protein [Candidatus Villigracilis affinis]|uniref:hypothetical protein n=1 Tax=Candidatus Villigracilis affinis TaxID=3140682 RepID=UPI002A1D984C|nr:hypothetical protein [Anaerolineales bacterium]
MQYELIFRGSLVQYWQAIHTGWQRAIRKNSQGQEPFRLSHARPPREYEELTIEFLDDNRRRSLITVDALSGADGNFVKLIVHIEREAYENNAGSALAKWNKLKGTWERKGW